MEFRHSKLTSSFSGSSNTSIVSFKALASTIKRVEVDYYLWGNSTAGNFQGGSIAFVAPAVNDEDGITFPTLIAGATASIPFTITNPLAQAGKLNAWIDWNNDGDFLDLNEQIATNVSASAGGTLSIAVPAGAATSTPLGARFRLSTTSGLAATGAAPDGEVEDYLVTVQPSLAIGNLVWNDTNLNGIFDGGEVGIMASPCSCIPQRMLLLEMVTMFLSRPPRQIRAAVYSFTNQLVGTYVVKVTPTAAFPLTSGPVVTTDNQTNNDNNGSQPGGQGTAIYSPVITLAAGTESVTDGDTDNNSDLTIDFALRPYPVITISPTVLPAGNVGSLYSQGLTATGGNGSYSWSMTGGSIPAGTTFTTGGVLVGTPTVSGTFVFTAQATDTTNSSGSAAISVTIRPLPSIYAMAKDDTGGYIVGGEFYEVNGSPHVNIVRLNRDGSVDETFAPGVPNGPVYAVTIRSGVVYAGGAFTTWGGSTQNLLVKLSSTGVRDTAFSGSVLSGNAGDAVHAISDSGFYVAGKFSSPRNGVAALDPSTGANVASFAPTGPSASGSIYDVFYDGSRILTAGDFTTFNGAARRGISALTNAGILDSAWTSTAVANNTVRSIAQDPLTFNLLAGGDFTTFGTASASKELPIWATPQDYRWAHSQETMA